VALIRPRDEATRIPPANPCLSATKPAHAPCFRGTQRHPRHTHVVVLAIVARTTYAAIRGPRCIRRHPTGQRKPATRVAKRSTVPMHPPADQRLTIAQIYDHASYITLPALPLRGHGRGQFRGGVDLLRARGRAWTWAWACTPAASPGSRRRHHKSSDLTIRVPSTTKSETSLSHWATARAIPSCTVRPPA
jgi:hypothetical protein